MAELALVASIVGIADVGVKISSGLYKVAIALKQAGKDIRNIANHLNSISSVLRHFAEVIRSKTDLLHPARALAEDLISSCDDRLMESQEMLDRLEPLLEQTGTRTDRAVLRVRWLLEKTKFATHQESLASLQGTLTLLITTMTYEHAAARNTSSVSDREHVENCVRDVLLDVQSAEVTVQASVQATVRQIASTSGTSHLMSLATPSTTADEHELTDSDENDVARDDAITDEDAESDSGANTMRLNVSNVGRRGRSPSSNQVVPYIREPVADSNAGIDDMSRALVPVFEIRFLQKRTLRFTREILGRHPQGGTPARHYSEEDNRRSPSLSQESGGARHQQSLHPEQHAQSRQAVDENLQQTPNSGSEPRDYRQYQSIRPEESIPSRGSSNEDSRGSPNFSQADYGRQSPSTVPPKIGVSESSTHHLQSLNNIDQGSSSRLASVNDIGSSNLVSLGQSFLLKDLKGRTHEIHFDIPESRDVSCATSFLRLLINLNKLDPEDLFYPQDDLSQFGRTTPRETRLELGPAPKIIHKDASAVTAKEIKVRAAVDALNHARALAIDEGRFTLLGQEGRVIQPRDWQKAIKPDSVMEITFDDPRLEMENLTKVDGGYVSPHLDGRVRDSRSLSKRALSRLGTRQ